VDREATGVLHLLPMRTGTIELEIRRPGVERQLSGCHGQWSYRDPRQRHVHQLSDVFDCTDLHLLREQPPQLLGLHVGLHCQYEIRRAQDRAVGDRPHADAMPCVAQRDRDRCGLQHRRQRSPQVCDHRGKTPLQVVMPIRWVGIRPPRLQEGGELARHLHQCGVQRLRMQVRRIGPMRQHVLPAVD
jgi:hypothetical protein